MAVTVDARRAYAKMAKLRSKVDAGLARTAKNMARIGVNFAKSRAPYDKGNTARAIHTKPIKLANNEKRWVILAPDVYPDAAARLDGLVKYMHSSRVGAQNHFRKDRDRKFMYSTRDYLNMKKAAVTKANFGEINIK